MAIALITLGRVCLIGMDRVEFKKSVSGRSICALRSFASRLPSSVTYEVHVSRRELHQSVEDVIFSTDITFVRVDENGEKIPVFAACDAHCQTEAAPPSRGTGCQTETER